MHFLELILLSFDSNSLDLCSIWQRIGICSGNCVELIRQQAIIWINGDQKAWHHRPSLYHGELRYSHYIANVRQWYGMHCYAVRLDGPWAKSLNSEDLVSKMCFLIQNFILIMLKCTSYIGDKSTLEGDGLLQWYEMRSGIAVPVMAAGVLALLTTSPCLIQCWLKSMTPCGVTGPQWVNYLCW